MLAPLELKVPDTVCVVPLKNTARVLGVNVPPFDRLPAIYKSPPLAEDMLNEPVVLAKLPVTLSEAVAAPILIEPPELVTFPVTVVAPVVELNNH